MTSLEETFGEDFVQQFKEERQRRRAERQKVDDETMAKICALAINEGKMDGKNPMFTYTSDSGIVHDVVLVTVPDPENRSYWSLKNDGNEGSVQLPLEYIGEWIWCWFNDREMAKKLDPGEDFIAAGRLDTWERDDGSEQDQFSPVRGIVHLSQAKEWADMALQEDGFSVPEQPEDEEPAVLSEEDEEEESEEEEKPVDDSGSMFGSSPSQEEDEEETSDTEEQFGQLLEEEEESTEEEDEELIPYADVEEQIENLAEQEPKVWEVDEDKPAMLDKLVNMVGNRLDVETNEEGVIENSDIAEEIREHTLQTIKNYNKEEEEEEEEEDEEEENLF